MRNVLIMTLVGSWVFLFPLMVAADETPPVTVGSWRKAAPAPSARTEVAAAVVAGKIYVIGGFSPLRFGNVRRLSVSDAVEVYDPARDLWRKAASLPKPLHHTAAVTIDQRLFVMGGFKPGMTSVWNPVTTVYEYLPDKDHWIERRPMPTARGALAAAVLHGKIVAIGGFDGDRSLSTVEIYDPASDRWEKAASLTVPRDHLAAASLDGRLYAIGGRINLDYHRNLAVTERYDPVTGRWNEVEPLPTPRSGIAAATLSRMIFVVGGEGGKGTFGENEAYWPKADRWVTLPPMPTPRHGLAAAVVAGRLYTLCGGPRPGGSYSRVNESFVPGSVSP